MLATIPGGQLLELPDCYILVPGYQNPIDGSEKIYPMALPDISDTKSAEYNDETIIGRSFPLKTYSHSGNRSISFTLHCFVTVKSDVELYLSWLRALQSCVYPSNEATSGAPYAPPKVCRIKCGQILAKEDLCVVMKSYTVKFPIDVAWDEATMLPWKFDIDTSWEVVYSSDDLPNDSRIIELGR